MLTTIREKATGWIAWAIVILITIPFALWGVNSYFDGGVSVNVAEFDGLEIDYQTYQRTLYNERDRIRQRNPNVNAQLLSGDVLGRQVVDQLVNQTLLTRATDDLGYRVSDEQLVEAIRAEPSFSTDGEFSRQRYEYVLQLSGMSVAQFEASQRSSASVQQIQTGFVHSGFALDAAADSLLNIFLQERKGQYAIIEPSEFLSQIEISEQEIQDEYDNNKIRYQEPEKIKVQYVEVSLSDFAADFSPSDETLRAIYDSEIESFRQEEQRNVSHILLDTEGDDSSEAEKLAADLIERLESGEQFGALAAEYSTDAGSAQNEGSIGWISRGVTAPEFDAVAFSLEQGQISDPVVSSFGVHIIQVNEIQTESIKEFDLVREQLVEQAATAQAEAELFEISEELRNIAYEQPESLDPVADILGLELEVTDWFTQDAGVGIAASTAIRSAAFGDEVRQQGFNSDLIETENNSFVILRRYENQEAQQLSVEDVEAQIKEELLVAKSYERANEHGVQLIETLNGGADWIETLASEGIEPKEIPSSDNAATDQSQFEISRLVYESKKPSAGGVVYGGDSLSDGKFAVYQLTEVISGDGSSASEEERQGIDGLLSLRFGAGLYENYVAQLRQGIDITVNDELL